MPTVTGDIWMDGYTTTSSNVSNTTFSFRQAYMPESEIALPEQKSMPETENSIQNQYLVTLEKILCGYELEMGIRPKKEIVEIEDGSCANPCFSCGRSSCKSCFPCKECGRRYFKDDFGLRTECIGNSKYKKDIYNGLLLLKDETGARLGKRGNKAEHHEPKPESGLAKGDVAYTYIDATAGLEIVLSPSSLDLAPKKINRVMSYVNEIISKRFEIELSPSPGAGFHLTFSIGRPLLQIEVDYLNQTMLKFLPAYILVGCTPYTFQRSIGFRFPTKNRIFNGYNKYHFLNGKKTNYGSTKIDLLEFRYPDSTPEISKMLGNILLCSATILSLNRSIQSIEAKTEKGWMTSYEKKLREELERQDDSLGFENMYRNQKCSIELLDLGNIVRKESSVIDGKHALGRLTSYLGKELKEIIKLSPSYKFNLMNCTQDWDLTDLKPKKFISNTRLDTPKLPITGERVDPLATALDELLEIT